MPTTSTTCCALAGFRDGPPLAGGAAAAAACRLLAPLCNAFLVEALAVPAPGAHQLPRRAARARRGGPARTPVVSVIVPARNEAGNIAQHLRAHAGDGRRHRAGLRRGPLDGRHLRRHRARDRGPPRAPAARLFRQTGKGKGDAVRLGFARGARRRADDPRRRPDRAARGPAALLRGAARRARASSSTACAWSIRWRSRRCASSTCSATSSSAWRSPGCSASRSRTRCAAPRCCGASDYERIAANRAYFGDFDPFGDFDLLFGAAKLNLKIVDLPIRYRERTYGDDQHPALAARLAAAADGALFAARRIKFI